MDVGISRLTASIGRVLDRTGDGETMILLETVAGQGTGLGRSAEEMAMMLEAVGASDRLGVCLDTCHVFAAGYELRDSEGYNNTIRIFNDRHEHIGEGEIGDAGFRNLMTDPRFRLVPKVLETPKIMDADVRNLARLRRLTGGG